MDTIITTSLSAQEEASLSEMLAECVAAMQKAQEKIEQDRIATEHSQARSWAMLREIQRSFHVETIPGLYSSGFQAD
ncbi:MAG: hypothetical protein HOP19_10010 [Acidobacteria bacterium]|nr:hypothetical protein [Acidobacteriota bacterium]